MVEHNSNLEYTIDTFSDQLVCCQDARLALEKKYANLLELTNKFNRQHVSYQANKTEALHDWLKYKEGFSATLVKMLIDDFKLKPGNLIMDPFMGSGTTSLVSQKHGIHSVGFDILPTSKVAFDVKINAANFDIVLLNNVLNEICKLDFPKNNKGIFSRVSITSGALSDDAESEVVFLTDWINKSNYKDNVKELIRFLIMAALEDISYTRKDGQYLRWDYRSSKIIQANRERLARGKPSFKTKLDKGEIPSLKRIILTQLSKVISDIQEVKKEMKELPTSKHQLILGSVLTELPKYDSTKVDCVITSPPYCNRYDYTRTYALELVYLGLSRDQIRDLRQTLLTCTVENRSKLNQLKQYYTQVNCSERFEEVIAAVNSNAALQEVLTSLRKRSERGDINNKGVIRMVEGYFTELAFVFKELHRVCKDGTHVVFVNDNVRYAGEVIPVDFITTELAESFGFTPIKVYVLPQKKGNSSQQMKKFGQVRLRKSITIWKK